MLNTTSLPRNFVWPLITGIAREKKHYQLKILIISTVPTNSSQTRSTQVLITQELRLSSGPCLPFRSCWWESFFFFFFNSRFYPVSIDIILRNQFYALSVWALLALLRGCADVASGKVSVLDHCKTGEEQVCNFPVTYSDSVVYRVQSNETGSSESGSSIFLRRKYSGYKSWTTLSTIHWILETFKTRWRSTDEWSKYKFIWSRNPVVCLCACSSMW